MNRLNQFLKYHYDNPNYLYFLVSLLLLILLPLIVSWFVFGELILKLIYGLVILLACIYTSKDYKDTLILGGLGIAAFLLFILNEELNLLTIFYPIISSIFFGLVFIRLIQYVFQPKSVSFNDILALCSGYIVLGVIASPFFFVIDIKLDNAFSIEEVGNYYDLLYFSFITLTSVGYGDIVPVHPIAKSISILHGIIGQLYLAIVVGIIIGKYLSQNDVNQQKT